MSLFKKLSELVVGREELKPAPVARQSRLKVMEIRERIYEIVGAHLAPHGFARKKPNDIWFRDRGIGFLDVVNIQTITPFGPAEMVLGNAGVGVHCEPLERTLSVLVGRKYVNYTSLCGSYLGYVMPKGKFIEWKFPRDHFAEDEARKMAEAIVQYGVPWFDKFTDLESLRFGIESSTRSRSLLLALLEDLLGRRESAIQILKSTIESSDKPEAMELERKALALFTGQEIAQ